MANMFGGKDAINPAYPTQWALNPNAYQNIDCSNVDWAALAQQWIAMKEAAAIVAAVPPVSKPDVEEGEAPMEVENPDVGNNDSNEMEPVGDQWTTAANPWGNNWNQWGWGVDPTMGNMGSNMAMPLMDGYAVSTDGNPASYATGAGPTFQHGYWTAQQTEQAPAATSRGSSSSRRSKSKNRESKSSSSRSHRNNRSITHREKAPIPPLMEAITTMPSATLDAAKRRQLPAWIREGLEKMEREKQKAIEREEEKKARELAEAEKKRLEEEELARMKAESTGEPVLPPKSKFESDSEAEESDKELPADDEPAQALAEAPSPPRIREPSPPPLVRKSKEEIMQEVMLAVRRSLTEILLEVTDREIHTVSQEELARYTAAQASRLNAMKASNSKALASIASGLGLGAYESSSEESDGEDEPREITDNQLQELIKRKRLEFEQTSREIEAEVRRAELREAGVEPDAFTDITPERRSRSSATPPPMESDTPKKIPERRLSDKKNNHHKSTDKVDGPRKLDTIPEKSRREHTPSPPKENHKKKDTSSSSSDSEGDSSSDDSESSLSEPEVKVEQRKSKKRKRKSSTDSDRKKSKKQKKDKRKPERSKRLEHDRKSRRKDDERSHKSSRSRDVREKSHKDKYREDSEDRRRSKRAKRTRSPSYESRRRSRARDVSEEYRPRRRERSYERSSRSDRYERSRDYDRRRSRSRTRSRSRHRR